MLNGIKILVAENNLVNQKIVNYILNKQGAIVKNVVNGMEAIALLPDGDFDVVLMDLQMPGMDGFEAARHIRGELGSNIPIIALTADMFANETSECRDAGINVCISKPFDPTALCEMILSLTRLGTMTK